MRYTLAVLSHGDTNIREQALASFQEMVTPAPEAIVNHHDDNSIGFCRSTQALWGMVSRLDSEFVFWLEHDFTIRRPIDLNLVSSVLRLRPQLVQVAFFRTPVNEREEQAGGVYQMHPPSDYRPQQEAGARWLEHRINFTTNPSLMRRQVMVDNPWPDYSSECEGKFSADFLARGYHFAYWGDGEPWVAHDGPMRTGHSY